MELFDTKQAATRLGISERWVRLMCQLGRLGQRVGSRWIITENELRTFKRKRRGRPKQTD